MSYSARLLWLPLVLPLALLGCEPGRSTLVSPQFAGSAGGPSVKSVTPAMSPKGTTLNITVNGSGFDQGTRAQLGQLGVPSAFVHTNSTTFVNSRQIIANVTIDPDAETALYDVIATTTTGKKGIGTELFAVEDPTATFYLSNDANHFLRGDASTSFVEGASSPFAGMSRYKDAECGVDNTLFWPVGSGDAIMATGSDRKCAGSPRKVRITYSLINADGSTLSDGSLTVGTTLNVRQLQQAGVSSILIGETQTRTMAFSDDDLKCGPAGIGAIVFRTVLQDGTIAGADLVQVYRSAADTWIVSTQPDEVDASTGRVTHHDKAYCRNNGKLYHMPFRLAIRTNVPLP